MEKNITQEGYAKLKEELRVLEEIERPKVAKHLEAAIAEGDLSENASYEEAKERQAQTEGRIHELKRILSSANIVESERGNKIGVGTLFTVRASDGTQRTFTITGSAEANPSEGKISFDSPLGDAFFGHKKGDKVEVKTPSGVKQYTIVSLG